MKTDYFAIFKGTGNPPFCCYWTGSILFYHLRDYLGSTRAVVDSTGQMYAAYDYFSTGRKTDQNWLVRGTEYQFLGKEFDEERGFDKSYFGARYFDSKTFQFNSVEPLLVGPGAGGNIKSVNYGLYFGTPYTYSLNNPIKFVDRDGKAVGLAGAALSWVFLETGADIASLGFSVSDYYKNPTWTNLGLVGADAFFVTLVGGPNVPGYFRHANKVGDAFRAFKTARRSGQGFKSINAFKGAFGSAGEGMAWHHIVGQTDSNILKFGAENIHNTDNIIKLAHGKGSIHAKISGYYSSKRSFTNGLTVREWLNTQSYSQQYEFGIQTLKNFGWTP